MTLPIRSCAYCAVEFVTSWPYARDCARCQSAHYCCVLHRTLAWSDGHRDECIEYLGDERVELTSDGVDLGGADEAKAIVAALHRGRAWQPTGSAAD